MNTTDGDDQLAVKFFRLSPALEPHFTALYLFDFTGPPGLYMEDRLHPEWAVMRFCHGAVPIAAIGSEPMRPQWPFVVSGPTSKSIHFSITRSRIWGLGLHPTGWARFVRGKARDFADRTVDGSQEPAFAVFAPIQQITADLARSPEDTAREIDAYLLGHLGSPCRHELQVSYLHQAVRDPDVDNVADLAWRLWINTKALERLCSRFFGFPPKQLLRRQRFLRSLARFMLNPAGQSWIDALDQQYYDQAQFVRDFRSFMGMTPSEYAEMPHPVLSRIMAQRMADAGAVPQTDLPTILRYRNDARGEG